MKKVHNKLMHTSFYEVPTRAWLFRQTACHLQADGPTIMPEEQVRQWCLHELIRAYGVSICDLDIEWPVKVARERKPNRIDIVILKNGKPHIVIECKTRGEKDHKAAIDQAVNYASLPEVNAEFAVYTNGEIWWVRRHVRGQWIVVPNIPTLPGGKPAGNWRDILQAVDRMAPILFWIDEVVPAKMASRYFGALQEFFYAENKVTTGTDHNLLLTADHILRVLDDVTRHPNYTREKMSHACEGLNRYWQERGAEPPFGGGDLWEMAHHAWADLSHLLEGHRDTVSLDYQIMRVIQSLLSYLNGMKGSQDRYQDVGNTIQSEIRAYIDLALAVRFNARLPDIQDGILIADVRDSCKDRWEGYLKSEQAWPPGILRAFFSYFTKRLLGQVGFRDAVR